MNIKKWFVFGAVYSFSVLIALPCHAVTSRVGSAQDLGLGFQLGQPIGVIAKYWLTSSTAMDAASGYHFNHNFDAHADYLWHTYSSFDVGSGRLPFYAGVGGRILLGDDSQFGLRLPAGVSYLFPSDPVELFAEIAPIVKLLPGVGVDVDGAVGFRLYINYLK